MATAPVEKKVTAASAAAFLGSTGLLGVLAAVQDDARLVGFLPDGLSPFVLALVPAAATFVAGWKAKHTPRTGILR
ncbi:phage protein [Streptomyces sp. L-9-10]|uniref:holin n=1 Tax=Streptomyces sp. L-9-10 TaxID=1478131 RepID=UPI00101BADA4|nr:holin [Streptomyces sp. L-9-10]RYJ26464.1 phage protein [Streptomyces sp. L-9-10]